MVSRYIIAVKKSCGALLYVDNPVRLYVRDIFYKYNTRRKKCVIILRTDQLMTTFVVYHIVSKTDEYKNDHIRKNV